MLKTKEIFIKNAETFYNYRTGAPFSMMPRSVLLLIAGILLSLNFGKVHDDLYTGLIAVQSILLGFGFNVLFYLSTNPILFQDQEVSLEAEAKVEKLTSLANETFYNVSYFNLISSFSIAFCCCALLLNAVDNIWILSFLRYFPKIIDWIDVNGPILSAVLSHVVVSLAFITSIDAFLTFTRIVKRMTYMFKERLALRQ